MYVTEQEPWKLAKDDANAERLRTVLYTMCEALSNCDLAQSRDAEVHVHTLWVGWARRRILAQLRKQRLQVGALGTAAPGSMVTKETACSRVWKKSRSRRGCPIRSARSARPVGRECR